MTALRLRDLPRDAKIFLSAFLVVLSLGYVSGLSYVYLTTSMLPGGIATHYAGSADESKMEFPKSPLALMQTTHNHVLSLSLVFALVDVLLFATAISPRLRTALIAESFGSLLVSFGSLWLIRYVSPYFSWLLFASGIAMAVTFFITVIIALQEIWRTSRRLPQVSTNIVENC